MENVVFDGRNIFQRRFQNRTFPNRVHKKTFFEKCPKMGGRGLLPGGWGLFPRFPASDLPMEPPEAYTFGIERNLESRTPRGPRGRRMFERVVHHIMLWLCGAHFKPSTGGSTLEVFWAFIFDPSQIWEFQDLPQIES